MGAILSLQVASWISLPNDIDGVPTMGVTDPNITRPIQQMEPDSWLNSLGAYDTWEGGDIALDLPRILTRSARYYFMGTAFPTGGDTAFAALASFSGNVSVPPYSYLTSITAMNTLTSGNDNGFKFSIYDKGAQTQLFQNTFAWKTTAAGVMPVSAGAIYSRTTVGIGPYFPISPMIILPPGSLQIEITNLSMGTTTQIQILLAFAVPINPVTLGKVQVKPTS